MTVVFETVNVAKMDASQMTKEYDKLQRENVKLKDKLEQVGKAGTKAGKDSTKGFTDMQRAGVGAANSIKNAIAGIATGTFGVAALIQNFQAAMRDAEELDRKRRTSQLTVGQAQAAVVKNLGAISTEDAGKFISGISGIQEEAGFGDLKSLLLAASDTLSATGGDQALTQTIVSQSAPLFKDAPEQLAAFASSVADIATIKGASTADEIKGVISTVLSAQSQARITSLGAFPNVAQAIAGASGSDTSGDKDRAIREASALFAAIGGSIKDPEGGLTKTATADLASQLRELLPEKDVIGVDGSVVRQGTGLSTLGERIAAVQADENLQRLFLRGDSSQGVSAASFRGPIMPVIEQMLTDTGSEAAKRFRDALGAVSDDPKTYDQLATNLRSATAQLRLTDIDQRSRASRESIAVGDEAAGIRSQVSEDVTTTLAETRGGLSGALGIDRLGEEAYGIGAKSLLQLELQSGGDASTAGLRQLLARRREIVEGGFDSPMSALLSETAKSYTTGGLHTIGRGLLSVTGLDRATGLDRLAPTQIQSEETLRARAADVLAGADADQVAKLTDAQQTQVKQLDEAIKVLARIAEATGATAEATTKTPSAVGSSAVAASALGAGRLGR